MSIVRFDVAKIAASEVLYGEGRGQKLCKVLVNHKLPSTEEGLIALDFGRVEHASASFLRESVLGYASFVRSSRARWHVFVANMDGDTTEELGLILRDRNECFVSATLSADGKVSAAKVLGLSDGQHLRTLQVLLCGDELSVGEVRRRLSDADRPAGTALNGRLEWLSARGLLISRQDGREKLYRFPYGGK